MNLPSVSPQMLNAGTERFLSRFIPMLGISLSEMDYLRGWKDDFLGDAIADQYDITDIVGAGSSITLRDTAHGGWLRLMAGAAVGRYARLWLGDTVGGYDNLDPDDGFVIITKASANAIVDVVHGVIETDAPANNAIQARFDSAVGANWILRTYNAGATSTIDSGIVVDTAWHWHVLDVTSGRVEWFLDGASIVVKTTDIPTVCMTACWRCFSRGAAARTMDLDFVAVIPR